ncbi:MAG: hypothetical protein AAGA99_21345 [Actinomycetota bacterium]
MEVRDRQLVERAGAGDEAAWAAIVERHADVVYGTAAAMQRAESAASATLDVFTAARRRLRELTEPDALRAWLLAITRVRLLSDPPAAVDSSDDLRVAAASLESRDRFLVELVVVHRIGGRELAQAMGVAPARAAALETRARRRLEQAIGALELVRGAGATGCLGLASAIAAHGRRFDIEVRRTVLRHVDDCPVCMIDPLPADVTVSAIGAPAEVVAAAIAAADGVRVVPPPLRDGWQRGWPPSAGGEPSARDAVAVAVGEDEVGLARRDERRRRIGILVGAAAAGLIVIAGLALGGSDGEGRSDGLDVDFLGAAELSATSTLAPRTLLAEAQAAPPIATTTTPPPATTVGTTPPGAVVDDGPTATTTTVSPTTAPPATTPPRTGSSPAPSPTTTTSTTTTTTTQPSGGQLAASPPSLSLAPGTTTTVRLSNVGPDTVDWSASPSVGLGVSPAGGSLRAGTSAPITVTTGTRASSGTITVNGGLSPVVISVQVAAPPPSTEPPVSSTTTTTTTTPSPPTTEASPSTETPGFDIEPDGGIVVIPVEPEGSSQ